MPKANSDHWVSSFTVYAFKVSTLLQSSVYVLKGKIKTFLNCLQDPQK